MKKLDELFAPIAGKTQEAEDAYIAEYEKFQDMAAAEAKKRGVPDEDLDLFMEVFSEHISRDRPAIEWNSEMTHRQIFEQTLKDYQEERKGEKQKTAIPEEEIKLTPAGVGPEKAKEIDEEAKKAATSPSSGLPEPTEGQKAAGNYQKGHVNLHGLDISIENPRGSVRSNIKTSEIEKLIASARGQAKSSLESALVEARKGNYRGALNLIGRAHGLSSANAATREFYDKSWATEVAHPYGYIRGTRGKDKDHLDVFIGPNPESLKVFVIDQVNPETGKFDEQKVMLGFNAEEEAREGYLANYAKGWKGLGAISMESMDKFKEWIKGDTTKPIAKNLQEAKTAIPEEKAKESPIREERNGKEVKPGVTLRKISEDLMSQDPGKEEAAIALLVSSVRSGKISKEDALNVRNEILNIAHEQWVQSGRGEEAYAEFYDRTQEPAKRIAAAEAEMVEPETKGAIPETEKPSRDTVMKDLIAGRITPTKAAETLGIEVSELKKELQKEITKTKKEQKEKAKAEPEPEEIKAAGTNRPTAPKTKEEEAKPEPEAENPEEKHVAEIAVAKLPDRISEKGQEIWKRYLDRMVGILHMSKYEPGRLPLSTLENARAWFLKLYDAGRKGEPEPTKTEGVKINALEREVYQAGKEEAGKKQELKKAGAGPEKGKEEKPAAPSEKPEAPPKLGPEGEKAWAEWQDTFTKDMPADKYKRLRDLFEEIYQAGKEGRPPIKNGQTFKMSEMEQKAWYAGDADREEEPTEPPKAPKNHWLRNPQTGKIELYFNKADFDKLQDKVKERIRVRFLWAPSKKAWVSKATKDMFWPETIVRDLTTLGVFGKQEAPKAEKTGVEKPAAGEKKADIEAEVSKLTEQDLDEMLDEAFEEKPDKAKEKMPTVEGDAARPYAPGIVEKPKASDLGIKEKEPTMYRVKIGEEKAWTNRNIIDRGELPYKTEGRILPTEEDVTGFWNDSVPASTHSLGEPWLSVASTVNHPMDLVVWGTQFSSQPLAVDLKYFSYFKTQYPDAQFFYGKDKTHKNLGRKMESYQREILVKSNGKPVGMVMPVRNTYLSHDDVEGFRPKEAKFVPPDGWETNLMKARMYASHLKIPHVGRKLEALVVDITTKLAGMNIGKIPKVTAEKRSLTQILKDVSDLGVKGADETMKGLYELFGGSTLKSFPAGFDSETYAKAKPHFEAAFKAFKEAGLGLKEFLAEMRKQLGDKVKPYLRYFIQEKMGVNEEPGTRNEKRETQPDLTENTGKGERGARKKLTAQEQAEKDAKEKAAAERKAKKAGMGEFKNVGYVYDPEHLNKKTKDKAPRSAGKIILDEMTPAKLWDVEFAEGSTHGVVRMKDQVQNMFKTFREFLLYKSEIRNYGGRRASMEAKLDAWFSRGQGNIEKLKEWAKEYGRTIQPYITAFEGQTSITGAIGGLQQTAYPGVGIKYTWPETKDQMPKDGKAAPLNNWDDINSFMKFGSEKYFFDFLKKDWKSLLGQENQILLSEIDVNKRGRNTNVVRAGLPDYREGVDLKKTEDFQAPFGFKGVGFGEEGWINQEERNRVIPAAYDAFKDLAATIKAPDKGMSLGGDLAVQFANLGHKARGAAAAFFPAINTINFTRDNGDGTMAHEWGHALHALAAPKAIDEINAIIKTLNHVYDFEAGERLANDLLAKDSPFLKRIISSKKQERIQAVKDRIKQEFIPTVRKETDYFKTAKAMDAEYTARNQEMWARAWEAFIHDTLAGTDNYLVTDFVAAGRVGGHAGVGTMLVYPAGKEREKFNETIQHFVDGLTWDENGKPSLKDDYETIDKHNEALLKPSWRNSWPRSRNAIRRSGPPSPPRMGNSGTGTTRPNSRR